MTEGISKGEINYFTPRRVDENCDLIIADFQKTNYRYDLSYFSDVFDPREISSDEALINSINRSFEKKLSHKPQDEVEKIFHAKKRSEALEIIIASQIELNDWFGEMLFFIEPQSLMIK